MAAVKTHASYTEAWECDANAHLNVQFYFRRFHEALAALCALDGRAAPLAVQRHVRFHREQRLDEAAVVHSGVVRDGPAAGKVLHVMTAAPGGALVATSLDDLGDASRLPGEWGAEDAVPGLPRGVDGAPSDPADARGLLAAGRAVLSDVSLAYPHRFGADGGFLPHQFIAGFSNGAVHLWSGLGITREWLEARNLGRVAVEQKLTPFAAVEPGMVLRQISWVAEAAEKTVLFSHQVEDARTGAPLVRGDVRALLMDLGARKAVPMPREVLEMAETRS